MRYIPYRTPPPELEWKEWLAESERILGLLKKATSLDERKAIIDKNDKHWGKIRGWLLSLSHDKCWFTEARDTCSYYHIEHFRPKKSTKDETGIEVHDGYWWLAFDWTNFRIAGGVPNVAKSTYFPLHSSGVRAIDCDSDLNNEIPFLLDPTNPLDPTLLFFNFLGEVKPKPNLNEWNTKRAEFSIKAYKLNGHDPLVNARKAVWSECSRLINDSITELDKIPILMARGESPAAANISAKKALERLHELSCENAEFSSVAGSCIRAAASTYPEKAEFLVGLL